MSEQVTSVDNRATSFKTAKIVAEKLNPKYLLLNSFVCHISHRQPSQQLQIPLRQSAAALWCVYATQALSVHTVYVRAALYFVSIGIKYNVNRERQMDKVGECIPFQQRGLLRQLVKGLGWPIQIQEQTELLSHALIRYSMECD